MKRLLALPMLLMALSATADETPRLRMAQAATIFPPPGGDGVDLCAGEDPCANGEAAIYNDALACWECATAGVADHGGLTGLTPDDDHPHYFDLSTNNLFTKAGWDTFADTPDGADVNQLRLGAGGAISVDRGAYATFDGNEGAGTGSIFFFLGDVATAVGEWRTFDVGSTISIIAEAGATDTDFSVASGGISLAGAAGTLWTTGAGVQTYFTDRIGIGAATEAGSACIDNDAADRLFHDTNCDGTKDAGELFVDLGMPDKDYSFDAAGLATINAASPTPATFNGTNLDTHYLAYANAGGECASGKIFVPTDVDTAGTVTFTLVSYGPAASTSDNVEYEFQHLTRTDGEALDTAQTLENSGDLLVDDDAEDVDIHTWTETLTNLTWTAGEEVFFDICRTVPSSDDLAGAHHVLSFTITIPRT